MFKVNNKNTRATSMMSFWCLYCKLWTYFITCSIVFITNFEQVDADWESSLRLWENLSCEIHMIFLSDSVRKTNTNS